MPTSRSDVVVVGAGPAGLAAAAAATRAGSTVTVVDNAPRPGGQFWRHPTHGSRGVADLQHDIRTFAPLRAALAGATHLPEHDVWAIARDHDGFTVHALHQGPEVAIGGQALVLAPGAYDRQIPFPGWDLPGVYTAGGAQALLKGHQVTVGPRVVVGGTGPFLLPVAAGLATRGATVAGVFEANRPSGWLRHLPTVARAVGKAAEGASYAAVLARHRVPYRTRHAIIAAHGKQRVEAVTVAQLAPDWTVRPGTSRTVRCDAVAVGWGFTPRLELPLALGCETRVDADGSLVVAVDQRQASSVPGVFVAGEAAGVGGASLAVVEGEIAGTAAAAHAGMAGRPPSGALRARPALRAFAEAMHAVHPVPDGWRSWLTPETLVCRCEEVSVAAVREAVHHLGATDSRSAKLLCRAGMGWCQGRVCGYPVSIIVAAETGSPASRHGLSERPVAVPVTLGALADPATNPADSSTKPRPEHPPAGPTARRKDPPRREHP